MHTIVAQCIVQWAQKMQLLILPWFRLLASLSGDINLRGLKAWGEYSPWQGKYPLTGFGEISRPIGFPNREPPEAIRDEGVRDTYWDPSGWGYFP